MRTNRSATEKKKTACHFGPGFWHILFFIDIFVWSLSSMEEIPQPPGIDKPGI